VPARPEGVGAGRHLQTAVLARGGIDGDHAAGEVRPQAGVVVPVAVILVPRPRPADAGLLEDHLVVPVIHLVAQQPSHGPRDALAADDGGVDRLVVQLVLDLELYRPALAVGAADGGAGQLGVGSGDLP